MRQKIFSFVALFALALILLACTPAPSKRPPITAENANQLTRLARWEVNGSVSKMAWSKQGIIATASSIGVSVYNVETLEPIWLVTDYGRVWSVAVNPEGTLIAAGSPDGTIRLMRANDGTLVRELKGHTSAVESLAFNQDGTLLASASDDTTVRLWRVSDGSFVRELSHPSWVWDVAFSPDGTLLVTGSLDSIVRLWRVSDGNMLFEMKAHNASVQSVAFSPDGKLLASGGKEGLIRLWRTSDGTLVRNVKMFHAIEINSIAFSPDGLWLAAGYLDNAARLWRVSDGALVGQLIDSPAPATSVAFNSTGDFLAVANRSAGIGFWRLSDMQEPRKLKPESYYSIALSPDGSILATVDYENTRAYLWHTSDRKLIRVIGDGISRVEFSPDGSLIASTASNETVSIWRASDGTLFRKLETKKVYTQSGKFVAPTAPRTLFSPDAKLLATWGTSGIVQLWQVNDGELLYEWNFNSPQFPGIRTDLLSDVAFSADSKSLTIMSRDKRQVWRLEDRVQIAESSWTQRAGVFNRDDTLFASQGGSNSIRIWRVADNAVVQEIRLPDSQYLTPVAFDLDGSLVVTLNNGGLLYLWRVKDGSMVQMLGQARWYGQGLTFSRDGTLLIVQDSNSAIEFWGVESQFSQFPSSYPR